MGKQHEVLAVREAFRKQLVTCLADLENTFEKKRTHFSEKTVTFKSLKEGVEPKIESQLGLQTTIAQELQWIAEKFVKTVDVSAEVDHTNTFATSDIILEDGTVIISMVPVTTLLELDDRIEQMRKLVAAIPTLDPAAGFKEDPQRGTGIYRARDVEKPRTEKIFEYVVMVQPTDKFPAQVKELNNDRTVGYTVTQEWSSLITVAAKGEMLDRIEGLGRAVKRALARANDITTTPVKIGQALWDFAILGRKSKDE